MQFEIDRIKGWNYCKNCGKRYQQHFRNTCPPTVMEFMTPFEPIDPQAMAMERFQQAEEEKFQKQDPVAWAKALITAIESHIRIYSELANSHLNTAKKGHVLKPIHCWDRGYHTGWGNSSVSYLRDLQAIAKYYREKIPQ